MIKNLQPTLAEAGKIKIGGLGEERKSKKGGTYRLPVKYEHFVLTTTERDGAGGLIPDATLMDSLPKDETGNLTAIPIYLHGDEIDQVFPTAYACYTGKKLHCTGDGESATRYEIKNSERTGASKEVECPCGYLDADSGITCKPHGTLSCSIAAPGQAIAGAVHKWRTTSMISISRMVGSLRQILGIAGGLRGLPLTLRLTPVVVRDGQITVYCCHVELRARDMEEARGLIYAAANVRSAVGPARPVVSLPAADESELEQAEVQQEFHPEPPDPMPDHDPETGEVIAAPANKVISTPVGKIDLGADALRDRLGE